MKYLVILLLAVALVSLAVAQEGGDDHAEQFKDVCGLQGFSKSR